MLSDILIALLLAVAGGVLYTIIGIIPGTDETATMVPLTLIVVLAGAPHGAVLAWLIGIIVAMQISHTIPTAMAALPGSTMAVPMVQSCAIAKRLGIPHIAMRKMATGSLIGTMVGIAVGIIAALLLSPIGPFIAKYSGEIFTLCAVIIAFMSSAKWAAVIALIPFSVLIQALQRIAVETVGHTVFICIFMGITIGPMIYELFTVLVPEKRAQQARDKVSECWLAPETSGKKMPLFPNPFRNVTKKQLAYITGLSALSTITFTMSPVGMTVVVGELAGGRCDELYDKITTRLAVQDAASNATYLGAVLIPLLGLSGMPIGPLASGVASPLFNCAPRYTLEANIAAYLTLPDYIIFCIIGLIGGAIFAYPVSMHKARAWTALMFKSISHEALIGTFCGLIVMLAFYEAGFIGVIIAITIGLFGGFLHSYFGVHTGVQFMGYYASSWITTTLMTIGAALL